MKIGGENSGAWPRCWPRGDEGHESRRILGSVGLVVEGRKLVEDVEDVERR